MQSVDGGLEAHCKTSDQHGGGELMRWKVILAGIAAVIALWLVAVYILLFSYQFNDLKPRITQAVRDATGRELKVGGDIRLKAGLSPSLLVDEVSFQNATWGSRPELATVKRVEVQVALVPLLRKKIEVKRFILDGMDVLIETDSSGESNLAFKTAAGKPIAPAGEQRGGVEAMLAALSFHEVRIERSLLAYREGRSGKTDKLGLEELIISATGADSPLQVTLKGAYNDNPVEAEGSVGSLLGLIAPGTPWLLKLAVKTGGVVLKVEGEFRDALQPKRSFALTADAQGPSVSEVVKLAGAAAVPEVGPFSLNARILGQGNELNIEKIDLKAGSEDRARFELAGVIKNPVAQRGIQMDFKIFGKDLANVGHLVGQPLPVKGPFQLSGQAADTAENTYKVSGLKVTLGGNDVSGELELNLSGERPRLNGSVSSQKLDLRTFLPESKKTAGGFGQPLQVGARRDRIFPSEPLPLAGLSTADAMLQIHAEQVLTPRLALSDLTMGIELGGGALNLKPLKGSLGGGSFDAHLGLTPKGQGAAVQVTAKASGLNLGRVARDLQVSERLSGNLNLDLDVKGVGSSVAELMAGLNGKLFLTGGNVHIENKYLELFGADLSGSSVRLLNPFAREENHTEITCFVGGFDIRDGLAQSTALVVDTQHMTVVGDGRINLKTEQLDISLNPSPKVGVGFTGLGKVGFSAGELTKVFKVSGALAHPSLAMDPTKSSLAIGKTVGGAMLFGPAGIAASLAQGSKGNENPCLTAIEAAKKGVKPGAESGQGMMEKATEGAKGAVKGTGERIKKLFGR